VAIAAGYVATDRGIVFAGPVYDEENFYYCTYVGSLFSTVFKNSLLVCRRKRDGALVYVTNTQQYSLDTGATYIKQAAMLARTKPVIKGDRLYLTSGWVTNIGPQLFCIDKRTGAKIYSIAYDPPAVVRQALGVQFITTTADYSTNPAFRGSNGAVCDLDPVVKNGKIFLGSASLQNLHNPGLLPASSNYTNYPFWTDRGSMTVVKEFFNSAAVQSQVYTTARPLVVGDVLSLTDPETNAFIPGTTSVLFSTIAPLGQPIVSPGAIDGTYAFAQKVSSAVAPVTPVNLAAFWSTIGANISVVNSASQVTTGLTLANALTLVNTTPGAYTLLARLADPTLVTGTLSSGQFAVWYVKQLSVGDTITNKYDANGLGYYGYSTWGSKPLVRDDRVTYGTGQAHSLPISERLQFSPDDMNYRQLKRRLVDLSVQYSTAPTSALLYQLNQEKERFAERIRQLAILEIRSPRGQRSYVDAIVSSNIADGEIRFGVRSISSDVYNFLGTRDPVTLVVPRRQDVDGDLASSVFESESQQVSAASKHGGLLTLDLTHWNRCAKWTHGSPCDVGINVEPIVYTGTNSSLGGTNYSSTYRTRACGNLHLLAIAANIATLTTDGTTGTSGLEVEKFVSEEGEYIPTDTSYVYSYDQDEREVSWNTPLQGTAFGNVAVSGKYLYCNDLSGHLYVLNAKTGKILQTINSGADSTPMLGGIASPAIDARSKQVFWIASYNVPLRPPAASQYGWTLKLHNKHK
ncbi:Hypothetical protein POVR2_LOCUS282, partial [uncultured virus]